MHLTNEAKSEVQRLLCAGRKSEAARYLCETFSFSVKDAQVRIAAVEAELNDADILYHHVDDNLIREVMRLYLDESKTAAIKFVMAWYNIDLREAQDRLDFIIHGQPR